MFFFSFRAYQRLTKQVPKKETLRYGRHYPPSLKFVYLILFFQPPAPEEKVNLHFISLVHKDGHLYELGTFYCVAIGSDFAYVL